MVTKIEITHVRQGQTGVEGSRDCDVRVHTADGYMDGEATVVLDRNRGIDGEWVVYGDCPSGVRENGNNHSG